MKKDTKNSKFDKVIDKWLEENKCKMPYARKMGNGLWDIFDGTNHVYCGDGGKQLFDDELRRIASDLNAKK